MVFLLLKATLGDQRVHDETICETVWIHDTVIYRALPCKSVILWSLPRIRKCLFFTVEVR